MALTFPISASIGQTYQSGSSNTYEWTGEYWKIKNVINFNDFSASISQRVTDGGDYAGGNGASGVVIIRYPSTLVVTVSAGLTSSTSTIGSNKVTEFTAGSGTIMFSKV